MPFVFISLQALIIGFVTFDLISALINFAELPQADLVRHLVFDGSVIVLSVVNIFYIIKAMSVPNVNLFRLELVYVFQLVCVGGLVYLLRQLQGSLDFERDLRDGMLFELTFYAIAMVACLGAIWKLWAKSNLIAQPRAQ
jgi:dolichyl-phosphate-mannose--protein O-mannosyl transferase